jgi:hypothetical protein
VEQSFTAIFVTYEVHVTEHRRLDDENDFELENSMKRDRKSSEISRHRSLSSGSKENFTALPSTEGLRDKYIEQYVITHGDPIQPGLRTRTDVHSDAEKQKWRV